MINQILVLQATTEMWVRGRMIDDDLRFDFWHFTLAVLIDHAPSH